MFSGIFPLLVFLSLEISSLADSAFAENAIVDGRIKRIMISQQTETEQLKGEGIFNQTI